MSADKLAGPKIGLGGLQSYSRSTVNFALSVESENLGTKRSKKLIVVRSTTASFHCLRRLGLTTCKLPSRASLCFDGKGSSLVI